MIQHNNYKLPHGLEYVGDGHTIRKTAIIHGKEGLNFIRELCHHLIAHPDPMIVPVYRFDYLGAQADNAHKYSYDMMRMGDISLEENTLIWQVGDAWRLWWDNPNMDPTKDFVVKSAVSYVTGGAAIGPEMAWKKYPKLMHFLKEVIALNRYHDLHGDNVMIDNDGEYRLIDLESFHNPPLSNPSNTWIVGDSSCQEKADSEYRLGV